MMSAPKFLEYEMALLLAKYGKSAVLKALAQKLNATPEQLEAILETRPTEKSSPRTRKRLSPSDVVEDLALKYPEKAQFLRILHGRFENRGFLPELRDVKRFFEQRQRPLGSAKSRADTFPKLAKLLAELDVSELKSLCDSQAQGAYSSLGIISDEILRRGR